MNLNDHKLKKSKYYYFGTNTLENELVYLQSQTLTRI